jgi:hypothetical protein
MAASDKKPRAIAKGRTGPGKPEKAQDAKVEKPAKLWVSPKLRDSLRPSSIRTSEVDPDLFGQLSSRDRMRTHPYVVLADKVLGKQQAATGNQTSKSEAHQSNADSSQAPPLRRRA